MAVNDVIPPARATEEMAIRVRLAVLEVIDRKFEVPPGKDRYPGGQRAIAKVIGISQPTLNQYFLSRTPKKSCPGIDVLVALRAYFRRVGDGPQTLDALLFGDSDAQIIHIERNFRHLEKKIDDRLDVVLKKLGDDSSRR